MYDHIGLKVNDLNASVRFYTAAFTGRIAGPAAGTAAGTAWLSV